MHPVSDDPEIVHVVTALLKLLDTYATPPATAIAIGVLIPEAAVVHPVSDNPDAVHAVTVLLS